MLKKILFVDHHAELGGGEIALLEIIKNLDREKFFPLVLLGNDGPFSEKLRKEKIDVIINKLPSYFRKLERAPGVKRSVFTYLKTIVNLSKFIKQTERTIKEHNIDIVYINTIKSLLYAAKAAKRSKCRIIWHLHDCLTKDFYPSWVIPIIVKLSYLADSVICVSCTVRDAYIKAKGDKKKAKVVYNGVDTSRFKPQIETEDIKQELGIANKRAISVIGRLEPWKGQKVFIKAARIICSRREDVIFLIVGAPLFGFEKYQQDLRNMVKDSGLENKVLFLGFRDDLEKIIGVSDIIAHPSAKPEPFGRDIIEAMACGKPVISTDTGATAEIIKNQKTGILIEPDNPYLLAKSIIGLLDNPRQIQILKSNAREVAVNIFDIKKIVAEITDIIDENI